MSLTSRGNNFVTGQWVIISKVNLYHFEKCLKSY